MGVGDPFLQTGEYASGLDQMSASKRQGGYFIKSLVQLHRWLALLLPLFTMYIARPSAD